MSERKEYELSDEQLERVLDASKPVPLIALQCGRPMSPYERANEVWKELAAEMGFECFSVRPVSGKANRFFSAEPVASLEEAK